MASSLPTLSEHILPIGDISEVVHLDSPEAASEPRDLPTELSELHIDSSFDHAVRCEDLAAMIATSNTTFPPQTNAPVSDPADSSLSLPQPDHCQTCSEQILLDESSNSELLAVESISSCHIDDLPDELMHIILSFFTLGELCRTVAQVCRRWYSLVCDPIHWQELVVGHLPAESLEFCLQRALLLRKLDLGWRMQLTTAEVYQFSTKCPQLSELSLGFCESLTNQLLTVISEHCHSLQSINLEGCRLVDDDSLMLLSRLPSLHCLNLSHCTRIQTEGIEVLARNLKHIREIDIDGIPSVTDSAIFTLVRHHADHIEKVSLDGAELTDAAVQAFIDCRNLKALKFSFAELLTDVALVHLKKMTQLQVIKLKKGADFSEESLYDFFKTGSFSSMQHLDLSECERLSDRGVQALVDRCGKTLRHLILCWCWNITDVGLQAIVAKCPLLETLLLVGLDKIQGQCLAQVPTTMTKLLLLDLQQCNQVIDDLVVEVVRSLPQLVVYNYYGERFQSARGSVLLIQ